MENLHVAAVGEARQTAAETHRFPAGACNRCFASSCTRRLNVGVRRRFPIFEKGFPGRGGKK